MSGTKNSDPAGVINLSQRRGNTHLTLRFSNAAQEIADWLVRELPGHTINEIVPMAHRLQQFARKAASESGFLYVEGRGVKDEARSQRLNHLISLRQTHAKWKRLAAVSPAHENAPETKTQKPRIAKLERKKTPIHMDSEVMFELRAMSRERNDTSIGNTVEFALAYMALCLAHSRKKNGAVFAKFPLAPNLHEQNMLITFGRP